MRQKGSAQDFDEMFQRLCTSKKKNKAFKTSVYFNRPFFTVLEAFENLTLTLCKP